MSDIGIRNDLIHLDDPQPLEIRDEEKREVFGRIIPYGEQILIRGRPESFALGVLADVDITKTKLFANHGHLQGRNAIGRGLTLEERSDGAYASFRVSKTAAGDEMMELLRDGVVDGFSAGFFTGVQTRDGVHTKVRAMPEVSLVYAPAYKGAQVLSVREKEGSVPDSDVVEVQEPTPATVDLTPLETRMDSLQTGLERLQASVDVPPPVSRRNITPFRWFYAKFQANFNRRGEFLERFNEDFEAEKPAIMETRWYQDKLETRAALADVTGDFPGTPGAQTDATGLIAEEYVASLLVNVLDTRRPMLRNLGSFSMPRSGVIRFPVVTQHTLVDARGAQKADIPTRELIVNDVLYEAAWYAGGVDVSLELIKMAEIPVMDFIWQDLLGQYAIATEDAVVDVFDAMVTAGGWVFTGAVLDTSSYEAFVTQVATQALVVRTNTGAPATHLFVTDAQWVALVAMVDASDRRQFAANPSNSDATVALNAESFTLPGGIIVQHVPGLASAVLTNQEAYLVSDGGVDRVESINVQKMGRDIGLLGRIMQVPRIPAGVVLFRTSA